MDARVNHPRRRVRGGANPAQRAAPASEDAIYERLMAAIFEHRLPPGTKLGEESLAAIFGVSRARIRRVLPRLAHDGVVHLEPNRGAFVAKPTVQEARDVFEARRVTSTRRSGFCNSRCTIAGSMTRRASNTSPAS